MFWRKKGSLELSVNAIVVIVIAITMLGLGLGFLRGIFSNSLGKVEDQLRGIEQQTIDSLKLDCEDGLCLQSTNIEVEKNKEFHLWLVAYNNFDCDITNLKVKIGTFDWGSVKFGTADCQFIPTEDPAKQPKCEDISIQIAPSPNLDQKQKQEMLIMIKPKSTVKPTIYTYPIVLTGSCGSNSISEKKVLTLNVQG